MPRRTDYVDAAVRWHRDLQLLPSDASLESTDHLTGLAAECVCKALLAALGAPESPDGGLEPRRLLVHLPFVLDELLCMSAGRNAVGLVARLPDSNPFRDWTIDDRYVADGLLTDKDCAARRDSLDQLLSALQTAALDGKLS
jgi:hypothetical protein